MIKPEQAALIWFAQQLVGVNEKGNTSIVNKMRKIVDGVASGEPWCACFVQFAVAEIDELMHLMTMGGAPARIAKTESTQALWNDAPPETKSLLPAAGTIIVWRLLSDPAHGHCGIVTKVTAEKLVTVEGNTSAIPGTSEEERNGHGVWEKQRINGNIPGYMRLGYLNPWG